MIRFLAGVLAFSFTAATALAAETHVMSGGAIEPGLKAVADAYRKQTGADVKISFNTTPQMRTRVGSGESFDVVIAPPAAIEEFAKAGRVADGERANVGRVGGGIAVRDGAPQPDISSSEAVKRAMLEAESVVFNRASTGLYFENLLKKMGIYEQIEARTTRYPDGASVMEHVVRGKGREIGFGPITEILLYRDKGLKLVGPLPPEIQNYTSYTAVPMAAATNRDGALAFLRYLATPAAKALFVTHGIE